MAVVLPKTNIITTLTPSKIDSLQGQDQPILSVFPIFKIELQLYRFTNFRSDKVTDEGFQKLLRTNLDFGYHPFPGFNHKLHYRADQDEANKQACYFIPIGSTLHLQPIKDRYYSTFNAYRYGD